MSATLTPARSSNGRLPPAVPELPIWRLTLSEYHRLVADGFFDEDQNVEFIEGFLVPKMPRTPSHDFTVSRTTQRLIRLLAEDQWNVRCQMAITLTESEPEPDIVVAKGPDSRYAKRHPGPVDVAMVAEGSETSLRFDRQTKGGIFAEAHLPVYWILNVAHRQIEVYTEPGLNAKGQPAYLKKKVYRPGDQVPVVLFGQEVGKLAVGELLPG